MDSRPCLICQRQEDDVLHGPPRSAMSHLIPVTEYHTYDPGERRKLIRRMEDRVRRIEDSVARADRRVADRRREPF